MPEVFAASGVDARIYVEGLEVACLWPRTTMSVPEPPYLQGDDWEREAVLLEAHRAAWLRYWGVPDTGFTLEQFRDPKKIDWDAWLAHVSSQTETPGD
jgi:hypothetical protein